MLEEFIRQRSSEAFLKLFIKYTKSEILSMRLSDLDSKESQNAQQKYLVRISQHLNEYRRTKSAGLIPFGGVDGQSQLDFVGDEKVIILTQEIRSMLI